MTYDRPPAAPDLEAEAEAEREDLDEDAPEHLDPDTITDGDATAAVICRWVRGDADARRRQLEISHLLGVVRDRSDEQVWDLVLRVLALQRGRGEDLGLLLVHRAFSDGRRHPLLPRDERDDRDGLPALTPETLANTELLGAAIDTVLSTDTGLAGIGRQIRRGWARVRARVDERTWRNVVAIEELLHQRASAAQEILVAWAYWQGGATKLSPKPKK